VGGEIRSCRGAIGLGAERRPHIAMYKSTTRGGPTRACSRLFAASGSERLTHLVRCQSAEEQPKRALPGAGVALEHRSDILWDTSCIFLA
jgi:hypothetical protein